MKIGLLVPLFAGTRNGIIIFELYTMNHYDVWNQKTIVIRLKCGEFKDYN